MEIQGHVRALGAACRLQLHVLRTDASQIMALATVPLFTIVFLKIVRQVHHAAVFALTVLATALATAGTATIMASLFVVTRSARTFQNSLSWPFYVLGGVLVPATFLPDWLEALSTVVFLSWSADLLRASLAPGPVDDVGTRLAAILLLGAGGFAIGFALLARMLRQARRNATLGLA